MTTVSVIGTAGGKESGNMSTSALYTAMIRRAESIITEEFKLDPGNVTLVSGGAAFSDHVAVELYNKSPRGWKDLHIYFPCPWLPDRMCHLDTGSYDWWTNPGKLANTLHAQFAYILGRHTQVDFVTAQSTGAKFFYGQGFHARNAYVAASQYLIAFTFGANMDEYKGGTAHTPGSSVWVGKSMFRSIICKRTPGKSQIKTYFIVNQKIEIPHSIFIHKSNFS